MLASVATGQHGTDNAMLLTVAAAVALGVFFTALARWLKVSAIVVLLLGGMLVGPEALNIVRPDTLGDALRTIIALAVGIILFEGGLSLDRKGYREASDAIRGVLTRGVLVTWLVTTLTLGLLFPHLGWRFNLLTASLIIVTGPTVIGPLLKRTRVRRRLHHILHWEGVLIDPIGVFIALLCFEFVVVPGAENALAALGQFVLRICIGLVIGTVGGLGLAQLLKRQMIPEDGVNITAVATAVAIFGFSDVFAQESGLLSCTVAGLWVGYSEIPSLRALRQYKAELIELLIGLLFVLLAANLQLERFVQLGWRGLIAVLTVMLIVRPLNILISTKGSALTLREKLFLSWIAPRGIVAASMASLFAIEIVAINPHWGSAGAFLEAFTYSVIAGTVIVQGFSARLVGQALKVLEPKQTGWLVVGAHELAREVGKFIHKTGLHVVLVDIDVHAIAVAQRLQLPVINESILTVDDDIYPELYGVGNIIAMTKSPDLNIRACRRFHLQHRDLELYRWNDHEQDSEAPADHEMVAGTPVWSVLRSSMLRVLDAGIAGQCLDRRVCDVKDIRHPERVLLCWHEGAITPYVPPEAEGTVSILSYTPLAVGLDLNLKPEWIVYSDAASVPELFGTMLAQLKASHMELDIGTILSNLVHQENEYSSLVGYDTALPHFHIEDLDDSVVLAAKLHQPIKDLHSDSPIRYVFLVLSPSDKPKAHLNALAEISRFIMDEDNRERLDRAKDLPALQHAFFPKLPVSIESDPEAN